MRPGAGFVAHLATAIAHLFYRVDVIGAPPAAGPVLLLPNHPNALLDPAIVIATAGRPVRFLAKSTLFTGPFAPLMKAAGAIPVYRRQDAADVERNRETFAAVDAALARGEAICLFPEGISHSSGKLEPLRTGAARMALSAAAAGIGVRLVPVGINLESKTAFRSRVSIAYGQPLPIAPDEAQGAGAAQTLTSRIADRMRTVIVEAEPTQDAALVARLHRLLQSERAPVDRAEALAQRRTIAEGLARLRRERPDWYDTALVQLRRYDDRLRRFDLPDIALDWNVSRAAAWRFVARELPAALVLVPVAALALAVFAVPYFLTSLAARVAKNMDLMATTKVFGGMAIYGAWVAALSAAAGFLWGVGAAFAAALLLSLLAVAGLFALEREAAAWRTARSWLAVRSARPATRRALKRRRAELAAVLDDVHEWMRDAG